MSNLTNFLFADSSVLRAQAAIFADANAVPVVVAATPTASTPAAENKFMKRKLPEPRDGRKDSARNLYRVHFDAMSYRTNCVFNFMANDGYHPSVEQPVGVRPRLSIYF